MKQETILQHNLKRKMQEVGISAHALEKRAGLKRSAVQNILHGRSHRPSAQILYAITKILGGSISELIGKFESDNDEQVQSPTVTDEDKTFNPSLYAEAAKMAHEIFVSQEITPSQNKALHFIEEIYSYAYENQCATIDEKFAQWLAKKWWGDKKLLN